MANNASLYSFITDNYTGQLSEKLADYLESNLSSLELSCQRSNNIISVELDDIYIKRISIGNDSGDAIKFDLLVIAQLAVTISHRGSYDSHPYEQWFCMSCKAELHDGFHNFRVNNISVYSKYSKYVAECLSDSLVPIISGAELDSVADKFLRCYYPQALDKPMALPVEQVVTNMGLNIMQLPINKYRAVFGQTHFTDTIVTCYDIDSEKYQTLELKKGTIIVDPDVYFLRNIGSYNNTVIHECVHWHLHRKFFELESLYNRQYRSISCRVDEGSTSDKHRSTYDWMEWQANALAPRILMPYAQAKAKAAEFISINERCFDGTDIIAETIVNMAEFFRVSKLAAKIRMLDLGYKEAAGVFNYVNNSYAPHYSFKENVISDKQTLTIDLQDLLSLYVSNISFRQLLASGSYIYIDGVVCINQPKYVLKNSAGYLQLTDYALNNPHECCLVFNRNIRTNTRYSPDTYHQQTLFRSAHSSQEQTVEYEDNEHNQKIQALAQSFHANLQESNAFFRTLPPGFSDTLIAHMKRVGYTNNGLSEASLLDVKTIQNMRNEKNVKLESIIAVCIALHLEPRYSKDLLRKAGVDLSCTREDHGAYQLLLDLYYNESVRDCNILLDAVGIDPLVQDK